MISNLKSVTLQLSQKEFSFLMNSVNAKYFMDIMSNLTASFTMGDDDIEPSLVYGPTAFFHLYALAERWNVTPEDVLGIMLNLEQNGLVRYTLSESEYAIEPCISSFMATDDVVYQGTACDTSLKDLCLEKMSAEQVADAVAHHNGLVTLIFPMVTLKKFSLKDGEHDDDYENSNGVVLNP